MLFRVGRRHRGVPADVDTGEHGAAGVANCAVLYHEPIHIPQATNNRKEGQKLGQCRVSTEM